MNGAHPDEASGAIEFPFDVFQPDPSLPPLPLVHENLADDVVEQMGRKEFSLVVSGLAHDPAAQTEMRKRRRRLKNRVSARASLAKKNKKNTAKTHAFENLSREATYLRMRLEAAAQENATLRKQLAHNCTCGGLRWS